MRANHQRPTGARRFLSAEGLEMVHVLWSDALQGLLDDPVPASDAVETFNDLAVVARDLDWDIWAEASAVGSTYEIQRLKGILNA